ncbi:UPF0061 protein [Thiohalobacter sp. COW1]|uniref:protein adenylyltransferase SelO n=1 Tax=Thiohalobacter sp. COW1 TaxID=2795687 RepID=UPI00191656E0|nr:YdiU family protein [Thiohalobacter sp. COW1]BCO31707.1 UPF0061 protein [Thiohalobacter sp. COW1]
MITSSAPVARLHPLETLEFTNSYARLGPAFHSPVAPTPLSDPHLISFNADLAGQLGLDPAEAGRPGFLAWLNGEHRLPGSEPVAMLYAGHQFGHYVPQLGDGRAIILGEICTDHGERWELQSKGAGPTPYSRNGDGRAVLRSTLREYLCSEAMHALGVPTTRALCMAGSNEEVYRERIERGALLLRAAPSHVRFGSFEVFYYRNQFPQLQLLADYVITHHYPQLQQADNPCLALYQEVVERTARLLAQWQLIGFAHGVMNTDNMSILGLTLDYGPFGFMDTYDPGFVCNHSDHAGRYAFDRQPDIGLWNLSCLGQALLPLLDENAEAAAELATAQFERYRDIFTAHYEAGLRAKLGLQTAGTHDLELAQEFLALLADDGRDHTLSFRRLAMFDSGDNADNRDLRDQFINREAFDAWSARYRDRLRRENSDDAVRRAAMNRVNPRYILRNYLAQQAIEQAEAGDYSELERLLQILRRPFDEQPEHAAYAAEPPDWSRSITLSCSS